jgi:hypothetical protein
MPTHRYGAVELLLCPMLHYTAVGVRVLAVMIACRQQAVAVQWPFSATAFCVGSA